MKTKIEVVTNFDKLSKNCQEKIFSELGYSLAQTYLESLLEPNIDIRVQEANLQLNTNYEPHNDNRPNSTPQSPKLQPSPNGSYQSIQQPTNTHLPINEKHESSEPTEG